jgi:hypothetical protein
VSSSLRARATAAESARRSALSVRPRTALCQRVYRHQIFVVHRHKRVLSTNTAFL